MIVKVAEIKELANGVDTEIEESKKEYALGIIRAHKARICAAEVMLEVATRRLAEAKADLLELLEDLKTF